MKTRVIQAERWAEVPQAELPKGVYDGVCGGYLVDVFMGGKLHRLYTQDGVRGMNVPCLVEVSAEGVTVETLPK